MDMTSLWKYLHITATVSLSIDKKMKCAFGDDPKFKQQSDTSQQAPNGMKRNETATRQQHMNEQNWPSHKSNCHNKQHKIISKTNRYNANQTSKQIKMLTVCLQLNMH